MNCSKHSDREAVGMCVRCHHLICEECKVKINNKYYGPYILVRIKQAILLILSI